MRKVALLGLSTLLITACNATTPPAAEVAQAASPAAGSQLLTAAEANMPMIRRVEFAGGRCVMKQFQEIGTSSNYFQVIHQNDGAVRMNIKMWAPYQAPSWDFNESHKSIYRGFSYGLSLEVYGFCKVNGTWVGAPVFRAN
ncbi:hypothetical protein GO986_00885 [Deinococcus sp. HMF7620]|uniref:Lipoprotein n=1 Tax=Deinococcus arboris TaxID=2682977 RepID=A0A7C9LZI3_9DEIO|nr:MULTISPECIES: hypothetical protein [Deinococcus]MBZ9752619.1 hypothetical protein [Deinococcus betulae]MVN85322.1 hypothetical protein [Deinococcus arboris]